MNTVPLMLGYLFYQQIQLSRMLLLETIRHFIHTMLILLRDGMSILVYESLLYSKYITSKSFCLNMSLDCCECLFSMKTMIVILFLFLLQLEREGKLLHPPKSPNVSHSNNSTLETKGKGGIKKIITEKIITTTTLERNKKEKKDGQPSTLERENEKNNKLASKPRVSDIPIGHKQERNKVRHSTGNDVQIIQPENGIAPIENAEVQKREYDPKRAMKFGIRVLPPNVPDDGVLKQSKTVENGVVTVEKKSIDVPDKPNHASTTQVKHENETEHKKPVVAKRREKMAPPIPNVRTKSNDSVTNISPDSSTNISEKSRTSFSRDDLNSSGIKRDENGIPQELPQHMFEAAKAARSNRKSTCELTIEDKQTKDKPIDMKIESKEESKASKKSKGKAPSPPEQEKRKAEDSILEKVKNVKDFLKNEKLHSSILHDSFVSTYSTNSSYNTSTPKAIKTKNLTNRDESINFSQDDIDDIVSKPFKRESDSLNNFYEDSKSNLSSNVDVRSVLSLNNSDKSGGSTTIELNNSDITLHSSPLDTTIHSTSDEASLLDENERKAASLGDLSRFEHKGKLSKPSTGTLERAQSLDISAEDADINESAISPKKRKANSVVETTFFSSSGEDTLPDMSDADKVVLKHKEPRLSLNMAKSSAMDGLNTFQRNRLKKASEFGNLEDAIVKGSNVSLESDNIQEASTKKNKQYELGLLKNDDHETSDILAKRIMDENLKVHFKLVSEFAKSTSDGSNMSSLDSTPELRPTSPPSNDNSKIKYEEKIGTSYDTNIPDDLKMSRNTYANSLERPKSDMMKKLLAKNPILNVHIDQNSQQKHESSISSTTETPTPMTDASKSAMHQPDIVNFDLKTSGQSKTYDDFVSNIRVGSNNNSLNYKKKPSYDSFLEWGEQSPKDGHGENIVTITTNEKSPTSNDQQKFSKTYTKSIEIGDSNVGRHAPDVLEGIKRRVEEKNIESANRANRTLYMEPPSMSITMTQEPVQKTVTVNVAEDDFGNKVITQNIEKVSTQYIRSKSEAPLQVEQVSFGIMKNATDIHQFNLEETDNREMDKKILDEIKRKNPNIHFTTDEPSYTKTETIILNTQLDEKQAFALMEKIKNDPSFISQKTPEELSELGIRIIHDLEDMKNESHDTVEVTKAIYSVKPDATSDTQVNLQSEGAKTKHREGKNHITEIQVVTPRTEKLMKDKSEVSKEKISNRQRIPTVEPPLTYELDISLLSDFISNERHHSAKQLIENRQQSRTKMNQIINEPKKHHSDFDLPRNSHIKFRTATYESPKGTIVTSTDLENRRQSQIDQMRTNFERSESTGPVSPKPAISVKPSNIPVKTTEKSKQGSSKIPVFMTQKSLSQDNLTEKGFSLPRSPPPTLSGSSGNISVTSIKSSSRHPSGL